jgi:hypothetical protein
LRVVEYNANANKLVAKENQFNDPPPKGAQYVLVTVELTYTTDGGASKSQAMMVSTDAVGPANSTYQRSDVSAVVPDELDLIKDVFPGGTIRGNVVFAVSPADSKTLLLYASGGFGNDDVFFVTAGTAAKPTTTTAATVPTGGTVGSRGNPVPVGTAVTVGDGWTMKVLMYVDNANKQVAAENQFNDPPKAGMQFVLVAVELTYTNEGSEPKSNAMLVSMNAVGPGNSSYSRSDTFAVAPNELDLVKDVFKGGTLTGNVLFEVKSSDAANLVVYASGGFGNDEVYFATK